jgi:hypothetical protein
MYVKSQTNQVKITEIVKSGGPYPYGGPTLYDTRFNVTVQNNGINSVSNLTLTCKSVYNNTDDSIWMEHSVQIDNLQVGESRESVVWGYFHISESRVVMLIATLRLGDVVLDELKQRIF